LQGLDIEGTVVNNEDLVAALPMLEDFILILKDVFAAWRVVS
jgi:hypothetical protein